MRKIHLRLITILTVMLSAALVGSGVLVHPANAIPSSSNAKNVTFYWHYQNSPVSVDGTQTHYVLNTTARFDFSTQQTAKQNSFFKPMGLPSVTVDFFVYPNLVGPATFNGTWQVFLWANSSASTPAVFNLRFREFPLGSGTAVYDSGQLTPNVVSAIGPNLGVPVYSYNLTTTTSLTHTFATNSTIDVSVTVNSGAASDTRIWYDSAFYPSKVIFPSVDRGHPARIWTEDSTGVVRTTFVATPGLVVVAKANVTDPFGGYDINATTTGSKDPLVTLTLVAPNGTTLVAAQSMTLISGGIAKFNNIFRYNVTLQGVPGTYTVTVSSADNSGNMEQSSFAFILGQTYNLTATIVDSHSVPLPGAILTGWAGGYKVFSQAADSNGLVQQTIVSGYYTLTVGWQGITVYQAPYSIASNIVLTLTAAVYYPKIVVTDDTGSPLQQALVSIAHPNGTILPTVVTGSDGSISLAKVPAGGFQLAVLWKTVNVDNATVQVSSDGPYTLKTKVYQLTVTVRDNTGASVQGAYVVLYNSYGVVYDFKSTDASGSVTLKVPVGTYAVVALYSTTYLYTPVTASTNKTGVVINSSGSLTLTLTSYPPSIISTSAFLVLVLAIIGLVVAVFVTYFIMKKRLPKILPRSRAMESTPSTFSQGKS